MTLPPSSLQVPMVQLPHADGLPLPAHATAGAAGLDLMAAVPEGKPVTLAPGARVLVPTGLTIALPPGFEGQVRPRSGLALNHGITVLNSPGTIDSDYRGEVGVILINHSDQAFVVERGQRIAQLVVAPVTYVVALACTGLADTGRGAGGFGSTGTHGPGRGAS
ncbi:MAG: dUTP diphosphatase [Rhodospirillaceae bacterium]